MKKIKWIIIGTLGVIALGIAVAALMVYKLFFCLQCVPTGEFIKKIDSPNKIYSINMYSVNGGGTVDWAVRGELENNKKIINKLKTIYWEYHKSDADVSWVNDDTVIINGHQLTIFEKDTYDWRNE